MYIIFDFENNKLDMNKLNISFTILLSIAAFLINSAFIAPTKVTPEELIGCWVYKSYKNGLKTFVKSKDFKSKKPGFKFRADGTLTKRMDPDYCMRVKGPYANTEGTWEILDDNVLSITYNCYDRINTNTYALKNVSKKKFSTKTLTSGRKDK